MSSFSADIFLPKKYKANLYEKVARKMLMKLTPGIELFITIKRENVWM
jgi:hypothetical protein